MMGDPTVDPDVDIDVCYRGHAQAWSAQMADIVRRKDGVPSGPAQESILRMGDQGFAFILYGDLLFNPNLMQIPQQLVPKHPSQDGLSVAQYHNKVDYYYRLFAIIDDQKESYDQESTQNKYVLNMDNYEIIFERVDRERNSTNIVLQNKYTNGSFPHTISQIVSEFSTSPLYQSSFTRPRPGIPTNFVPRRPPRPYPRQRRSVSTRRSPPKSINAVQGIYSMEEVNMEDPESIWDYCVHGLDNLPADDDFDLSLFVNAIEGIASDMNRFNKDTHPCAICGQRGHSFAGCPRLTNTNIEQAYIRLLLLVNRFVKGFNRLNRGNDKEDLKRIQHLTLAELDVIDRVDVSSLSHVSSTVKQEVKIRKILINASGTTP